MDAEMTAGLKIPKATSEPVAYTIFDGVENEEDDIFPDPISALIADSRRGGAVKTMERKSPSVIVPHPVGN